MPQLAYKFSLKFSTDSNYALHLPPALASQTTPKTSNPCLPIPQYKPHNFLESNEVLKACNKLTHIHRNLFASRPIRIRTEERSSTLEFIDKDSDYDILEPRLQLSTEVCKPVQKIQLNTSRLLKPQLRTTLKTSRNHHAKPSPKRTIPEKRKKF